MQDYDFFVADAGDFPDGSPYKLSGFVMDGDITVVLGRDVLGSVEPSGGSDKEAFIKDCQDGLEPHKGRFAAYVDGRLCGLGPDEIELGDIVRCYLGRCNVSIFRV